jgi:hypothetical protein
MRIIVGTYTYCIVIVIVLNDINVIVKSNDIYPGLIENNELLVSHKRAAECPSTQRWMQ